MQHHDCGGLFGSGDEKGIEVVREDARRGRKAVKFPGVNFRDFDRHQSQSEFSGTSTLTAREICTRDADCPAP